MTISADVTAQLGALLEEELPAAATLRRELHVKPELSHQERGTMRRLHAVLESDWEVVAEKSLLLRVKETSAPVIVLRAEMDALPIDEETEVDWASTNGAMHACGHDVHMAALVTVVRVLRRLADPLPIDTRALFQHSEESYPSGAEEVVATGALETPLRSSPVTYTRLSLGARSPSTLVLSMQPVITFE